MNAKDLDVPQTPAAAKRLRAWAIEQLPDAITDDLGTGEIRLNQELDRETGEVRFAADDVSLADADGKVWEVTEIQVYALYAGVGAPVDTDGTPATEAEQEALEGHVLGIFQADPWFWLPLALAFWSDLLRQRLAAPKRWAQWDPEAVDVARDNVRYLLLQLAAVELPDPAAQDVALRLAVDFTGSPAELVDAVKGITGLEAPER